MQPRSTMCAIVLSLTLFGPAAFAVEPVVFEVMDSGAMTLGSCQTLHKTDDCSSYHISGVTVTAEGTVLDLEGQPYLIEWTGPGYYLESGVVLQALGEAKAGLYDQHWLEIFPDRGKIHTSRFWKDKDGNRALSTSDTLTLVTGKVLKALEIKDVRLHVRAILLPEHPEPEERPERP